MITNLFKYIINKKSNLNNLDSFSFENNKNLLVSKVNSVNAFSNLCTVYPLKVITDNFFKLSLESFHNSNFIFYVNIKNKVTNSFSSVSFRNNIVYSNTVGKVNSLHKEDKYGTWLLSRKLQRFLLLYKFKNPYLVWYVIVKSTGIRRFFRSSLGHVTQLLIKLVKRYHYVLYRYYRWLLKFLRIIHRLKRPIMLTYRQRSHGTWLRYNILNRRKQTMYLYQVQLLTSYSNNTSKTRKRKGKFDFGY